MKAKSSCSDRFMLHILEKKEKKKFIVCLLLIFLPIFVANTIPLPKK